MRTAKMSVTDVNTSGRRHWKTSDHFLLNCAVS